MKETCLGIFTYLSKAFDTIIDHKILFIELYTFLIRGNSNDLIKSYLSHRTHITEALGENSESLLIKRGVPQGSVLGLLHFLLLSFTLMTSQMYLKMVHLCFFLIIPAYIYLFVQTLLLMHIEQLKKKFWYSVSISEAPSHNSLWKTFKGNYFSLFESHLSYCLSVWGGDNDEE